ncbi:MAG: hypothetical protein ACUVRD_05265, partial [Bacteroidia bacterium]
MKVFELFRETKAGSNLTPETLKLVEGWIEKYPYFALAHLIQAKVAHKLGDARALSLRAKAALYAPARAPYAEYIDEKYQVRVPPPPRITPTQRETHTPPPKTPTSSEEKEETSGDPQSMALPSHFLPKIHAYVQVRQRVLSTKFQKLRDEVALFPIIQAQPPSSPPPQKSTFSPTLHTTESLIWREKLFAGSDIIPLPIEPIPLPSNPPPPSPDVTDAESPAQTSEITPIVNDEMKRFTPLENTPAQEITPIVSDEMKRFTPLEDTPAQEITPIVNDEMKRFTPLENTPAQEITPIVSDEMKRFT